MNGSTSLELVATGTLRPLITSSGSITFGSLAYLVSIEAGLAEGSAVLSFRVTGRADDFDITDSHIVNVLFQHNGLSLTFDDGREVTAFLRTQDGVMVLEGLSAAEETALDTFNNYQIHRSSFLDPRLRYNGFPIIDVLGATDTVSGVGATPTGYLGDLYFSDGLVFVRGRSTGTTYSVKFAVSGSTLPRERGWIATTIDFDNNYTYGILQDGSQEDSSNIGWNYTPRIMKHNLNSNSYSFPYTAGFRPFGNARRQLYDVKYYDDKIYWIESQIGTDAVYDDVWYGFKKTQKAINSYDFIMRANTDGSNVECIYILVGDGLDYYLHLVSLDIDQDNNRLFAYRRNRPTDNSSEIISMALDKAAIPQMMIDSFMDGGHNGSQFETDVTVFLTITGVASPGEVPTDFVAVDQFKGKIYYTTHAEVDSKWRHMLWRCDLDGTDTELIIPNVVGPVEQADDIHRWFRSLHVNNSVVFYVMEGHDIIRRYDINKLETGGVLQGIPFSPSDLYDEVNPDGYALVPDSYLGSAYNPAVYGPPILQASVGDATKYYTFTR